MAWIRSSWRFSWITIQHGVCIAQSQLPYNSRIKRRWFVLDAIATSCPWCSKSSTSCFTPIRYWNSSSGKPNEPSCRQFDCSAKIPHSTASDFSSNHTKSETPRRHLDWWVWTFFFSKFEPKTKTKLELLIKLQVTWRNRCSIMVLHISKVKHGS